MVKIDITRNEVILLQKLAGKDCNSTIKAITIGKLTESMELSYFTVRNLLKALTYAGYCARGCDSGNAHTYYITRFGLEKLRELGVNS